MTLPPLWIDEPDEARHAADRPITWFVHLSDPRVAAWLARTSLDTCDYTEFAHHADAGKRLLRRQLTRMLLSVAANCHPGLIQFGRSIARAPIIRHPPGWHVAVAGCRTAALIGIARQSIGVDVEMVTDEQPAWDMLTPRERETVLTAAAVDQPAEWLARWVVKEAHAKRLGNPRQIVPPSIETAMSNDAGSARSSDGSSVLWLKRHEGYLMAVALSA